MFDAGRAQRARPTANRRRHCGGPARRLRDDLNVTDHGDGTFETGVWFVAAEHARTVRPVALHQAKDTPSYRQGTVIGRRSVIHKGKTRFVFRVRDDGLPRSWSGGGSASVRQARSTASSPSRPTIARRFGCIPGCSPTGSPRVSALSA